MSSWPVRPENPADHRDAAAIREVLLAAWIPELSLAAATRRAEQGGENLVVVLGHAEYYPRFGFTPAAGAGVLAPFDVPPEAFMSLALDPARPVPQGLVGYPAAFGI